MPKDEDGCSVRSWRCESPNRDDMEKGRTDGTTYIQVRLECKRCPVCYMVLCAYHMSEPSHMRDCNFRSNQERELLSAQRDERVREDQKKQEKDSRLLEAKKIFEEKERARHKTIKERNEKFKKG